MSYQAHYQLGPSNTPKPILNLILITASISILATLVGNAFTYFFGISSLENLLSLSWWGIQRGYAWQLLSYLFVQNNYGQGLTLNFFITLAFNLYILWLIGTVIWEHFGTRAFFTLYFLSGLLAGLAALFAMSLFGYYQMLSTPAPALLALLVAWTMLYPETELLLLFVFPIKIKWLTTAILGIIFLVAISQLDFVSMIFYFTGALVGYFYSLLAGNLEGPFSFLRKFELFIKKRFSRKNDATSKVVSFEKEKTITDEQFLDEMLSKIAKSGENSLTWEEKQRLQKISEKKSKK